MTREIFISYSRRDQEFVTRLASDLNSHVAGVWFDQAAIQAGQKWHDEIMDGIRECKAFILILSPDAVDSKYVREEVNKALELGKTIFPILYRPSTWSGEFAALVHEVQTIDLRSGSYTENVQKLVDGLIEAGAVKATGEIPFLREPSRIGMKVVLSKVPGWAFAWSLGWLVFWLIVFILLFVIAIAQDNVGREDLLNLLVILLSGGLGGFAGGLIAGLFTMLALRPNAPSVSWKHMSPTIRIWAISGPLGMVISGLLTSLLVALGAITVQSTDTNCAGPGFGECLGQVFVSALSEFIGLVILTLLVFLLFVVIAWFLTGMFAGWLAVRHIRKLEPGITGGQSRGVSLGWGCGAIVAAAVMVIVFGLMLNALGL